VLTHDSRGKEDIEKKEPEEKTRKQAHTQGLPKQICFKDEKESVKL